MLLPRCMRHLLAMAMMKADESGGSVDQSSVADSNTTDQIAPAAEQTTVTGSNGDWKGTVHALNVLRVVFVDATLANDVGPYVTEVRWCDHNINVNGSVRAWHSFQGQSLAGPCSDTF